MRRLLHVRDVEEERYRMALESALGECHMLEHARTIAIKREHAGREFLTASALTGEITDRTAALFEVKFAVRCAAVLVARIADAENNVMRAREAYIDKRIERRQAETLIEEAQAQDAIESLRRAQQSLDEAYGARLHRGKRGAGNRPAQTGTPSVPGNMPADSREFFTNRESKAPDESTLPSQSGTISHL